MAVESRSGGPIPERVEKLFASIVLPPDWQSPRYKSLADAIRDWVKAGDLQVGDPLPMKPQIAAWAHVSVDTVARSFSLLVRDRVLIGGRGRRLHVRGGQADASDSPQAPVPIQEIQGQVLDVRRADGVVEVCVGFGGGQAVTIPISWSRAQWLGIELGCAVTVCIKTADLILGGGAGL